MDRYMNIKTLSQYIPFTVSSIYTMVSRKKIPFIKKGKKLLFDRVQIDNWLNKGDENVEVPTFIG